MNIDQIELALSIARNKSFSLAAREFSYSQSAVSKHISSFEKELGMKLFERGARSQVIVTPAGEQLLPYLTKADAAFNELRKQAKTLVHNNSISLRIGCPYSLSTLGEDEILLKFSNYHPEIHVNQVSDSSAVIIELLHDHLIDASFIAMARQDEYPELLKNRWDSRLLREFRLMMAISDKHPLINNEDIFLKDLSDETFLFRSYSNDMEHDPKVECFIQACRQEGFEPKLEFEDTRSSMLFGMVATGKYIAPLMMRPKTLHPNVKVKSLGKDYYHFQLKFFFDKKNPSGALRKFVDFLDSKILPSGKASV